MRLPRNFDEWMEQAGLIANEGRMPAMASTHVACGGVIHPSDNAGTTCWGCSEPRLHHCECGETMTTDEGTIALFGEPHGDPLVGVPGLARAD
jgi:hypothetical protein